MKTIAAAAAAATVSAQGTNIYLPHTHTVRIARQLSDNEVFLPLLHFEEGEFLHVWRDNSTQRVLYHIYEDSAFERRAGFVLEDYAKGVFLLNHSACFICSRCRVEGSVVMEKGFYTGNSDVFKEVRVEFNYDPVNGVYREIGIVRDDSASGGNVYTLQSPLIKTENRSLKVAEAVLSNLNRFTGLLSGEIPTTTEYILSFDDPFEEFQRKVQQLGKELEGSGLSRNRE